MGKRLVALFAVLGVVVVALAGCRALDVDKDRDKDRNGGGNGAMYRESGGARSH